MQHSFKKKKFYSITLFRPLLHPKDKMAQARLRLTDLFITLVVSSSFKCLLSQHSKMHLETSEAEQWLDISTPYLTHRDSFRLVLCKYGH